MFKTKKEIEELEQRILILERRIEDYNREWKKTELRHIEWLDSKIENNRAAIINSERRIEKLERKGKREKKND